MTTYLFITFQDIHLYQNTGNFHIHMFGYITEIDNGLALKVIWFIVLASSSFPLNPVRMDNKTRTGDYCVTVFIFPATNDFFN